MKQPTLQEQYNLLQEGKGSKDTFMKSVRRLFPNLVNNTTPYDSAVTILKHKQIISEGVGGVVTTSPNPFANWAQFLNEEAKKIVSAKQNGDKSYTVKYSDDTTEKIYVSNDAWDEINDKYGKLTEAKAVEKKVSKEVTDMETRDFDYKSKKDIDNLYGEAFLEGYYAEMKDPKNEGKTVDELKEIVAKNMAKDCNYYMKNAAFGVKGIGYTDDVPGLRASKTDQMTPVKLKENMIKLVDLLNENLSGYVDIVPSGLGATYNVSEAEDKKEEEDRMRDAEKDDAAHIEDLEKDMKDDKKEDDKMKKEGLEHRLKEIEAAGNVAALEAKMNAIDEEMTARQAKLDMVSENEAIAEFINPTRIKEIQKEIKALEGAKTKYGKMYEKMTGKAYTKQVVDETDELGY